jgi:16S rRNA (guanine966-N2)-methyltransferase
MRVIAGSAKGVPLKAPNVSGLRPTSDLIRGAIFDILGQFFEVDTRVLDLYAGTGALGIEALSRGAGWADFVEQNAKVCAVIRENLNTAGLHGQARVHCLPVERASLTGPYDLIFMDPPYALEPDPSRALPLLGHGGRLVLEHSRRSSPPQERLIKQRRHGDTVVSIYGEAA